MLLGASFAKSKTEMALLGASTLARFVTRIWADGLEKKHIEMKFLNFTTRLTVGRNEKQPGK